MSFDVGAVVGHLNLRRDKWDESIKKVRADQKSLSGLVLKNSQQFRQMGRSMTIAGAAILGSIGLMVKAYGNFDKAMTESLAIMGDISEEMRQEMARAALEMSTKTTFAAKELAAAYFFLASAGMDAVQSMKALPVVAKFAQAGAFDLAVATDLLTDAQTAMGLSSKDAIENQKNLIKVSDILVKANTLANASVLQFSESLTNRAAAALVNVNKEMEEGVAVLAAFADKGVKGQKAGMRLAMMLNALDVSARKNKKAWKEHGLALFDAQGEMRGIGDIIADLESALGDMTTEQRAATLAQLGFNIRTKASILTLMGSSEKIKQWEKDLKSAGGTTEEVAEKQLLTLNNQFILLKNTITKAAISVGGSLAPAIQNLIIDLKNIVGKVSEWIKEHPKLTEIIAKSAVAIGGLLAVLGPLMIMLPGLVIALPAIAAGFTAMLGPIGLVVIALTTMATWTNHVINLHKKRSDAAMNAMVNTAKGHAEMWALRKKLIANEIVTVEEWKEIYEKHGKSHKRVMVAMANLPEYAHIREELESLIKKQEEVGDSDDDLGETLQKNSEATVDLMNEMVDDIMKATLEEFEYRKWAAQTTYDERKALLEAEKADKESFVLLERALAVELNTIEKERTQKLNEETNKRSAMLWDAINKGFEAEKVALDKVQLLHESYTNTIKELTLSEKDYKLWALDEWYAAELTKLGASLEAKMALEEAYGLKKQKIDIESAYNQMSLIEKVGTATMIALGQSKLGAISQAIMSTYAGAAKTIEMLGMPFAIPFVAMAILTGLKQVQAIKAVDIPSAAKGAYLPSPAIIEAGHGPLGEVVLPLDRVPRAFTEINNKSTGGINVELKFLAPLISTTGISDRDLDNVAESLLEKIETQIERYGGKVNA